LATALAAAAGLALASPAGASSQTGFRAGTPVLDRVTGGPWTLGQGDPTVGGPYDRSLPTFATGGSPTLTTGGVSFPNLAVYPGATPPPFASGFTGTPGPLPGYCSSGGPNPETGTRVPEPAGAILPMQPYYFPFVTGEGRDLTGYFDYRPKDSDEAVVAARSGDGGRTWRFAGEALELNAGICPNGNTNDDGQGHPFVTRVAGRSLLYTVNRPAADTLGSGLLVHRLSHPNGANPLAGLPAAEPVGTGGSTTATSAVTVPAGPGGAGVTVAVASTKGFEMPGRLYAGGVPVICSDNSGTATTFTGCVAVGTSAVPVTAGTAVTADAVVPADAAVTTGLVAPDGIVGILPRFSGAPRGATVVMYTEKLLNFFTPTTTTAAASLPSATIPVQSTTSPPGTASLALVNGSITISLGTAAGIQAVTCTGETATSFTGCGGGTGTVASGSQVGAPGAAVASAATLGAIGEGSTKPKTLFGNNEDLTVVRAAFTRNGVDFTDLGPIQGLGDPTSNSSSVLRWIGSRGSILAGEDGRLNLFLSGAFAADGDSDAFHEIFLSTSRDGRTWTSPSALISTDYTFSASAGASQSGGLLGISAYFSGRAYSPAVVRGEDGNLTLVFAGYRTPKPLPRSGTVLGTNPAAPYTVRTADPALYRNILTVTLRPRFEDQDR
jgi:hypothetical protein